MRQGTLLFDHRVIGALALASLLAALAFAHTHGGVSMQLGELLLELHPHQDGGLIVSFLRAP
jgi:hypothetical protein